VPIPLEPIDLLAGLAPDVQLDADGENPGAATTTVAETGRLLRSGDATVRRLIRRPMIAPREPAPDDEPSERERAGVPPRSRERPGE
jgi:hypothetical protein